MRLTFLRCLLAGALCLALSRVPARARPDITPPVLISAGSIDSTLIGVCFSEPVDASTATNPANYAVNGGVVGVASVVMQPDGQSVQLALAGGLQTFQVAVSNVRDLAGNTIVPESLVTGGEWASGVNVGFSVVPGSAFTCRDGDVDVTTGGYDIGGAVDQFYMVYQYWLNDFDMKVNVLALAATDSLSKAGLMARESLDDNSATIQVYTTPLPPSGAGVVQSTFRRTLGAATTQLGTNRATTLPKMWLRLTRAGNLFTTYSGADGVNWTKIGQTNLPLAGGLFVGLATAPRNDTLTTTAQFRGFGFAPGAIIIGQPQAQVVTNGANVTLSVAASGPQPTSFQWRLNGVNIPDATGPTYTLNSVTPADGGTYSVVVFNALGIETSQEAGLLVQSPPLPLTDTFGAGTLVTNQTGVGSGSNTNATRQAGEPNHAHQTGGKSVWLRWRAAFTGFVTFSARGSGFDTLLAAYTSTNATVTNLVEVASDDDQGGFATSQIKFNAQQNGIYYIAVDGFGGASGPIVLSWNFQFGLPVPQILVAPTNRVVTLGASTSFAPSAANAGGYQWLLNGVDIPAATTSSLSVTGAGPEDVGQYTLRIFGADPSQFIDTQPAYLEIASTPGVITRDKFEDLFAGGGPAFGAPQFARVKAQAQFVSVAAGTLQSQILNNVNSTTERGEPNHCGVLTAASRWLGLLNTNGSGLTFAIDTAGSGVNTVLAVYTGNTLLSLTNVTCAAGPGTNSSVVFPAAAGLPYAVAVDGSDPTQQGVIQLNWKLGSSPAFLSHPVSQVAAVGSNATFVVQAAGVPTPAFRWRSNGVDILDATGSTLTLNKLTLGHAGDYSVVASNFMGITTSAVAHLTVAYPFTLGYQRFVTNQMDALRVLGPANSLATNYYLVQGSTNLKDWISLRTNQLPVAVTNYLDPNRTNFPHRFYRLIPYSP